MGELTTGPSFKKSRYASATQSSLLIYLTREKNISKFSLEVNMLYFDKLKYHCRCDANDAK